MENQFYKVMNAHSDEKLLEVYKNRSGYKPEAVEAMEQVLSERNLMEHADRIVEVQQEEEIISREELYTRFQRSTFGKVMSDAAFAQERLNNSIYLQRYISPLHGYNWVNHIFIVLGIVGTVLALIILGTGEFHSTANTILTFSVVAALLLPFGIWKLFKNKAQLTIFKRVNSGVLVIAGPKDQHEIRFPLRYECYWEWHHIKSSLKQVKLSIFLYDDKRNSCIELREFLEVQKSPPPHWEQLPDHFSPKTASYFAYLNHGLQKPFLYEFEKILKGLHE